MRGEEGSSVCVFGEELDDKEKEVREKKVVNT